MDLDLVLGEGVAQCPGPLGPLPGTSVKSQVYADAITAGVTVRY